MQFNQLAALGFSKDTNAIYVEKFIQNREALNKDPGRIRNGVKEHAEQKNLRLAEEAFAKTEKDAEQEAVDYLQRVSQAELNWGNVAAYKEEAEKIAERNKYFLTVTRSHQLMAVKSLLEAQEPQLAFESIQGHLRAVTEGHQTVSFETSEKGQETFVTTRDKGTLTLMDEGKTLVVKTDAGETVFDSRVPRSSSETVAAYQQKIAQTDFSGKPGLLETKESRKIHELKLREVIPSFEILRGYGMTLDQRNLEFNLSPRGSLSEIVSRRRFPNDGKPAKKGGRLASKGFREEPETAEGMESAELRKFKEKLDRDLAVHILKIKDYYDWRLEQVPATDFIQRRKVLVELALGSAPLLPLGLVQSALEAISENVSIGPAFTHPVLAHVMICPDPISSAIGDFKLILEEYKSYFSMLDFLGKDGGTVCASCLVHRALGLPLYGVTNMLCMKALAGQSVPVKFSSSELAINSFKPAPSDAAWVQALAKSFEYLNPYKTRGKEEVFFNRIRFSDLTDATMLVALGPLSQMAWGDRKLKGRRNLTDLMKIEEQYKFMDEVNEFGKSAAPEVQARLFQSILEIESGKIDVDQLGQILPKLQGLNLYEGAVELLDTMRTMWVARRMQKVADRAVQLAEERFGVEVAPGVARLLKLGLFNPAHVPPLFLADKDKVPQENIYALYAAAFLLFPGTGKIFPGQALAQSLGSLHPDALRRAEEKTALLIAKLLAKISREKDSDQEVKEASDKETEKVRAPYFEALRLMEAVEQRPLVENQKTFDDRTIKALNLDKETLGTAYPELVLLRTTLVKLFSYHYDSAQAKGSFRADMQTLFQSVRQSLSLANTPEGLEEIFQQAINRFARERWDKAPASGDPWKASRPPTAIETDSKSVEEKLRKEIRGYFLKFKDRVRTPKRGDEDYSSRLSSSIHPLAPEYREQTPDGWVPTKRIRDAFDQYKQLIASSPDAISLNLFFLQEAGFGTQPIVLRSSFGGLGDREGDEALAFALKQLSEIMALVSKQRPALLSFAELASFERGLCSINSAALDAHQVGMVPLLRSNHLRKNIEDTKANLREAIYEWARAAHVEAVREALAKLDAESEKWSAKPEYADIVARLEKQSKDFSDAMHFQYPEIGTRKAGVSQKSTQESTESLVKLAESLKASNRFDSQAAFESAQKISQVLNDSPQIASKDFERILLEIMTAHLPKDRTLEPGWSSWPLYEIVRLDLDNSIQLPHGWFPKRRIRDTLDLYKQLIDVRSDMISQEFVPFLKEGFGTIAFILNWDKEGKFDDSKEEVLSFTLKKLGEMAVLASQRCPGLIGLAQLASFYGEVRDINPKAKQGMLSLGGGSFRKNVESLEVLRAVFYKKAQEAPPEELRRMLAQRDDKSGTWSAKPGFKEIVDKLRKLRKDFADLMRPPNPENAGKITYL